MQESPPHKRLCTIYLVGCNSPPSCDSRRTPHGASRLVQEAMPDIVGTRGSMGVRLQPCMTSVHEYTPPPPASVHISCFFVHQALLSHGADRSAADTAGNTALHWAAWVGNHLVVRLLSANTTREEINCRNEEG